jgi:hypothetical protein
MHPFPRDFFLPMTPGPLLFILVLVGACDRANAGRTEAASAASAAAGAVDTSRPWRKPGDKIDSILPMPEYLRRFRQGMVEPARLSGGAESRDELARRFLAALSARDASAFADLAVSRAEFAWLVFPHHLYHNPPYELDPDIFWIQLKAGSAEGLGATLQRYGGARLTLLGQSCQRDTVQIKSGPVRVWSACELRFRAGDSVLTRRLFGSIVERDGRLKLLSFANGS